MYVIHSIVYIANVLHTDAYNGRLKEPPSSSPIALELLSLKSTPYLPVVSGGWGGLMIQLLSSLCDSPLEPGFQPRKQGGYVDTNGATFLEAPPGGSSLAPWGRVTADVSGLAL